MVTAPNHAVSAPQQAAAPQPKDYSSTPLQWFLVFVVVSVLMDIWFDLESGFDVPALVIRYLGHLISKGGR
jgi:hypothetical protein